MIRSIKTRIQLYMVALILILFGIVFLAVALIMPKWFYNAQIETLENRVATIVSEISTSSDDQVMEALERLQSDMGGQVYVEAPMAGQGNGRRGNPHESSIGELRGSYVTTFYKNKFDINIFSFSLRLSEEVIVYEVTVESLNRAVDYMVRFILILLGVGLGIGVFVAWLLSRHISKPILRLNQLAIAMKEKNTTPVVVTKTQDEIYRLNQSMNAMYSELMENIDHLKYEIQRVKELEDGKKVFLASAAHEIKTPIAIIRGYAELLDDGLVKDEEERNAYVSTIYSETEKVTRLLEDLLNFAKFENNHAQMALKKVDVSAILENVIGSYEHLSAYQSMRIEKSIQENLLMMGDPLRVEQVFKNLLNNALTYGKTFVKLCLRQNAPDTFEFTIENDGEPISQTQLSQLFDVFQSSGKGYGLGLAIVKDIVEKLNGHIDVQTTALGLKFIVSFQGLLSN